MRLFPKKFKLKGPSKKPERSMGKSRWFVGDPLRNKKHGTGLESPAGQTETNNPKLIKLFEIFMDGAKSDQFPKSKGEKT